MIKGSSGQAAEIMKLDRETGALTIKGEAITLIEYYNTVIHIVNLTHYESAFQRLKHSVTQLPNDPPLQITMMINKINKELALFRYKRSKRGLLNVAGRGINFITGNMDDEDAEEIRNRLTSLENNQQSIANFSNSLFRINNVINDELYNITAHINGQSDQIRNVTSAMSKSISRIDIDLQSKILSDRILSSLQLLYNHITDLKQAIAFAHAGILSTHLLEPDEINDITIEQFELIKMGLLHNKKNNALYFALRVPVMMKKNCNILTIVPIPNYNGTYELSMDNNLKYITCEGIVYINENNELAQR